MIEITQDQDNKAKMNVTRRGYKHAKAKTKKDTWFSRMWKVSV